MDEDRRGGVGWIYEYDLQLTSDLTESDKIESKYNVFYTPGPHKFFSRVPWLLIGYVGPQQTRFSFDRIHYISINLNVFLHIVIVRISTYENMYNMLTSYIPNMNEILIILHLNIHIIFI